MIKAFWFGILLAQFTIVPNVFAELPTLQSNEEQVIDPVKRLNVRRLDPRLSNRQFASWLAGVVGRQSEIAWEMNDCGEQPGGTRDARDIPKCVQAQAATSAEWEVVVLIQIGTVNKGPLRKPVVKDAFIQHSGRSFTVRSLSELVRLLKSHPEKSGTFSGRTH